MGAILESKSRLWPRAPSDLAFGAEASNKRHVRARIVRWFMKSAELADGPIASRSGVKQRLILVEFSVQRQPLGDFAWAGGAKLTVQKENAATKRESEHATSSGRPIPPGSLARFLFQCKTAWTLEPAAVTSHDDIER